MRKIRSGRPKNWPRLGGQAELLGAGEDGRLGKLGSRHIVG